ncbi:GH32 C-terminal domain-containing protein [Natronolimnohabitans sp. A-GB9]|uniref:GH32 C-terminal domain-containing protein n=1 Tax=Natronolimnohabitans sp. A-GB9 TaxID=3069757 RepID=UPI0027B28377|nr:GH32 C-terminal domain-containing protein [Natronolimnohabitans sp. A-GB9]MDQ2052506.1 GH32 C-terminal domain-containing protein [Natronolimnohabitans sp. A-GB9]
MSEPAATVGFLVDGNQSPEQRAALEWCSANGIDVDIVSIEDVATGDDTSVGDGDYDVLWWHRAAAVEDIDALPDCREPIRSSLEDGGGLVLTLRALEAVRALGIDSVEPDVSTLEEPTTTVGVLWKSLYTDHPAVESFDELRVPTRDPGGPQPVARYESVLPERGEVLASTLREDHEAPHEVAVVGWRVGCGDVAGLGTGIRFEGETPVGPAENRTRLLCGLLDVLADDRVRIADERPKDAAALAADRERLAADPHRPQYHLSPPANWLNDPNGVIEWDGTYHAFYQYNPGGPYHGTIHWGHAVSEDLVHWEDRPVALSPSPDGPDRDGCWSGCAVDVDGTPTIVYTGGRDDLQLPCVGTATDAGLTGWEKSSANPVIDEPPVEPSLRSTDHWRAEFRDHCVWQADGTWHHLVGSGIEDGGGTALLYTSEDDDLTDWTYQGPILVGDPERDGHMWECPELLDLGEKQLLHVSNYETVRYFLGTYADGEFDVERTGVLDHGEFYAPQSLRDDDGRWLTWGWLEPARDEPAQWDAGWSGAMSLPRRIDLGPDGRLRQRPADELTDLRVERRDDGSAPVTLDDERRDVDVSGRALEIDLEVRLEDAAEFGLVVGESPDGDERTPIRYTRASELVVDRAHSSVDPRTAAEPVRMDVTPVDDSLSLRAFLDGSVLELFANDRHCLTTRIYPTRADSDGISLYATDGVATVESFDVWTLDSAWESEP